MAVPERVLIREVGPREGLQTLDTVIDTGVKKELIDRLLQTGVQEIEVTSFVRADRVPQMADAAALSALLPAKEKHRLRALYLNQKGFMLADDTQAYGNVGWIYTSASETFLQKNSNRTTNDIVSNLPSWVSLFKERKTPLYGLMISNAFGCAYEGEVAPSTVLDILQKTESAAVANGASFQEISLADTVGHATPESVKALVAGVKERFPDKDVSLHLHDTRGIGLVCAYAGLLEGVSIFEASVGGVGGCPFTPGAAGNICTEDLVYLFHAQGVETGLDLNAYCEAARYLASLPGIQLSGKLFRASLSC